MNKNKIHNIIFIQMSLKIHKVIYLFKEEEEFYKNYFEKYGNLYYKD